MTCCWIVLGETEKPCILELIDDRLYEEIEELRLVLGTPQSNCPFGAAVGEQNETLIRIRDDADSKKSFLLLNRKFGTEICVKISSGLENIPLFLTRLWKWLRNGEGRILKWNGEWNNSLKLKVDDEEYDLNPKH